MQRLTAALEQQPQDAQLHFELATIFCEHGDWAFAIAYADSADELQPGRYETNVVRGQAWLGAGDLARARTALDHHLLAHPNDGSARILRARVNQSTGGAPAAVTDYRAALLSRQLRDPAEVIEAATAVRLSGHAAEAGAALAAALDDYGPEPALLLAAVDAEGAAGHWDAALSRLDVLQHNAVRAEPWLARRAQLLVRAGRISEARATWQTLRSAIAALPNLERGRPQMQNLLAQAEAAIAETPAGPGEAAPGVAEVPSVAAAPAVTTTSPAADTTGAGATVALSVTVSAQVKPVTVTFFGRRTTPPTPGPDFAIGTLPDTQYYAENLNDRSASYAAQTRWYVDNRDLLNLAFVSHMGDIVNSGDLKSGASNRPEWIVADTAMRTLENPALTLRAHGIPWGGAPGNHDETPNGSATGTTTYFNEFFGISRFAGRRYYGGQYNTANNNNNYELFSASGLDFIIIHLQYDGRAATAYQSVLDWADALLKANPHRRAIITSHWIVGTGNPATFGAQGQAIYDRLKNNPNLFLLLCGHIAGEGRRVDTYGGQRVYSILQDYQSRANGGDGWLRYYVFSPTRNTITAKTYSPVLGRGETDADSEFTLSYDLQNSVSPWVALGTATAAAGATTAAMTWNGLEPSAHYEWYAIAQDDSGPTTTAVRRIATAEHAAPMVQLTSPTGFEPLDYRIPIRLVAAASSASGTIARVEFYEGETKLGQATAAPYELNWSAPRTGQYQLSAVAIDANGAATLSRVVTLTTFNPDNQPPLARLTTPASGARLLSPATIPLAVAASDSDGSVARVEFFADGVKIAERTTGPFSYNWPDVASGRYVFTARVTDNDGGVMISAPVAVTVVEPIVTALVARNSVWKYLDDGSNQGTAWRAPAFDDSNWAAGPAELGYGDGDEATIIGFGPNPASRALTTYFRHTFNVADPASIGELALNIVRDDGAIVYLNGTEIGRSGLTAGTSYAFNTPAPTAVDGADERTYFPLAFSTDPLRVIVRGVNTLAVEVHQQSGTSSDVSFNLELLNRRYPVGSPPTVNVNAAATSNLVAPATIALSATAGDADGTIAKVEFRGDGAKIAETNRSPYLATWSGITAGTHEVTAIATDNDGNVIASAPLVVVVRDAQPGRFINFSVRSTLGSGAGTLILGFVTGGEGTSGNKPLLLRAVGPGLANFGVAGCANDPIASLYSGSTVMAVNDNWSGNDQVRALSLQVGAFPLEPASGDAALVATRPPGAYSLQVAGSSGVALAEIYDATPATAYAPTTPRLINASVRALVGPGNDILIAGLVIGGATERTVLVRGIGPGLGSFGVTNALADPRLELFGGNELIASNDDWAGTAQLLSAFARAGAFILSPTSRDAALVVRLPPGAYTVQLSSPSGGTGVALLDMYELP